MGLFSDDDPPGVLPPKKTRQVLKERTDGRDSDNKGFLGIFRSKKLLVIVIAIMLGYNAYLYFTKDSKKADPETAALFDQSSLRPQPNATFTPTNLPLFYIPDEIYSDYSNKFDESRAKYNGNFMKVAGHIVASGSDANGQFVRLQEAREGQVHCYLAPEQENLQAFAKFKENSRIKIRGQCLGPAPTNQTIIVFSGCTLIDQ